MKSVLGQRAWLGNLGWAGGICHETGPLGGGSVLGTLGLRPAPGPPSGTEGAGCPPTLQPGPHADGLLSAGAQSRACPGPWEL